MKKAVLVALCAVTLFLLVSCGEKAIDVGDISPDNTDYTSVKVSGSIEPVKNSEYSDDMDRYQLTIPDGSARFDIPKSVIDGVGYGNYYYYIVAEQSAIYRADMLTGETVTFTEDIGYPVQICTDANGVYVCDKRMDEIVRFDFDGVRPDSVELPVRIRDFKRYADWAYIASFEHYDGVLMLAARDGVWTLADGKSTWKKVDVTLMGGEVISDASLRSNKRIVVGIFFDDRVHYPTTQVIECDLNGKKPVSLSSDLNYQTFFCNQNRVYGVSRDGCRLYELTEKGKIFIQTLRPSEDAAFGTTRRVIVSGGSVCVLWVVETYISTFPMADEYNTVRLIVPGSETDRVNRMVDSVSSVGVRYQIYDDAVFSDKLSASLLAKDADFDVALVTGDTDAVSTLLLSLLKNRQYADLYGDEELRRHIGEMFPGIGSMMEANGAFTVLPLGFEERFYGFNENAQNAGFSLPAQNWTIAEAGQFADERKRDGNGFSLFSTNENTSTQILLSMAVSSVQASVNMLSNDIGVKAQSALNDLFVTLEKYRDDGVLFGPKPAFTPIGNGVFIPYGVLSTAHTARFSLPPRAVKSTSTKHDIGEGSALTEGRQPLTITGFLFVNPNTDRLGQALNFLADLTNEENRYNALIYDSPLWPDLMQYYRDVDLSYDPETNEPYYDPHREPVVQPEQWGYYMKVNEFLPDWYAGSELNLVTVSDRAEQAVKDFCDGKVNGDDCAKVLYEELIYKLKG